MTDMCIYGWQKKTVYLAQFVKISLYLEFSGGIYTAPNSMLSGIFNNWPLHDIQRIQEHGELII
jgi:hypothetical protein